MVKGKEVEGNYTDKLVDVHNEKTENQASETYHIFRVIVHAWCIVHT